MLRQPTPTSSAAYLKPLQFQLHHSQAAVAGGREGSKKIEIKAAFQLRLRFHHGVSLPQNHSTIIHSTRAATTAVLVNSSSRVRFKLESHHHQRQTGAPGRTARAHLQSELDAQKVDDQIFNTTIAKTVETTKQSKSTMKSTQQTMKLIQIIITKFGVHRHLNQAVVTKTKKKEPELVDQD